MKRLYTSNGLLFVLPAVMAFFTAVSCQFRFFETRIIFILDSAHYWLVSTELYAIFKAVICGNWQIAQGLFHRPDFVANIMLDGPIMPLLGALSLLLSGQPANATSWPVISTVLSLAMAVSAGLVSLLSVRLTNNRGLSLLAGLIFASHPTVLGASGRFLTEPVAIFILVLMTWTAANLLSNPNEKHLQSLSLGILAACGFLLKPALVILWGSFAIFPVFVQASLKNKFRKTLTSISVGILSVMVVWLCFIKYASGEYQLMPQRQPASNVAQGHDFETDGRGAMGPRTYSPFRGEQANTEAILKDAWQFHAGETSSLYLRKISRIMGFVWNDFKQPFWGLDIDQQNFLHAFIVALGLVGAFILAFEVVSPKQFDGRFLIQIYVLFGLLIHALIYIPFESTVRYGAPALPFLILSAAFASDRIIRQKIWVSACLLISLIALVVVVKLDLAQTIFISSSLTSSLRFTAIIRFIVLVGSFLSVVLLTSEFATMPQRRTFPVLILVFFVLVVLPIEVTTLYKDNQREFALDLSAGSVVQRQKIDLPPVLKQNGRSYFLYIDSDTRLNEARISVNGVKLESCASSANKIDSSRYFTYNIMRMYSSVFGLPAEVLRQWRVVPIPAGVMKPSQNTLSVKAGDHGLTVYCDRMDPGETSLRLPSRALFAASRLCNEGTGLDARVLETSQTSRYSPAAVVEDSKIDHIDSQFQPRIFLLVATDASADITDPARNSAVYDKSIPLSSFDPVLSSAGGNNALKLDRYTMQLAKSNSVVIDLPSSFPLSKQLEVSLRGQIQALGRATKAGIFLAASSDKEKIFNVFPASPPFVKASREWKPFEISDRLILKKECEDLKLIVALFPGRWEQFAQYGVDSHVGSFLVKDLKLTVRDRSEIDLSAVTLNLL